MDASDYAAAAVLTQNVGDKLDKPVAFASVKLTPTQRNWATVEKEAFACIWALKKYHRWLFRNKVTIYSDHNPLTFLAQALSHSSKLRRWALPYKSMTLCLSIERASATQPRIVYLGLGRIFPSQQSRPRLCPDCVFLCFTIIACALASCFVVSIC